MKQNLIEPFEIEEPEHPIERDSTIPGEHHYDSYHEYIMSLIGLAVGYGSFWRFPYLIYKNGGGAFLIPYLLATVFIGMPLIYLETVIGQMNQKSIPFIFSRINKGLKILGVTYLIILFHIAGYYNIILAYSYRFIMSAFIVPLPFAGESPLQNTYFTKDILHKSSSLTQFGSINPWLFFLYVFSLFICYTVIKNGVKKSGKVVIFTVTLPYFFFIVLLIRGIFLDGSVQGLKYLFIPDWSKLLSIQIWIDALVQMFFQFTFGTSSIINLSSIKPKKEKFVMGIYFLPLSIIICGFLSALNIFMYLGHFCHEASLQISDLKLDGTQLSFNVFPKALAILPWPNLWVFLFFLAMIFLGIDSEFGIIETICCYINNEIDANEGQVKIFAFRLNKKKVLKLLMLGLCCFSPFLASSAGIYYLQFLDSFVANIPLSLGTFITYYVFVYKFPFSELEKESQRCTGEKAPEWVQLLLNSKVLLTILVANLLFRFMHQFWFFFEESFTFCVAGWVITSYPYILAYIYWIRNREQRWKLTFQQIKKG